mmetsp:Transcript_43063/g.69989  ORF Transcript_43063/g.69989 Transcript_43063/m.69989 type:complete len:107 (-) Transcript_43063:698-1018(-)
MLLISAAKLCMEYDGDANDKDDGEVGLGVFAVTVDGDFVEDVDDDSSVNRMAPGNVNRWSSPSFSSVVWALPVATAASLTSKIIGAQRLGDRSSTSKIALSSSSSS